MPPVILEIEMPDSFEDFRLPEGVNGLSAEAASLT